MRPFFAFALAAGLAACAPMQWVKPDAAVDAGQVRVDEQACRQAAWREAQFHSYWAQTRMQPVVVGPGQVIWPSGPFVDPFGDQLLMESRLAQFCMESKGYQLTPVPKQ
jgi:hypothetical protein